MRITKKMQSKPVYPKASKKLALAGNPIVRFTITESGDIKLGALSMVRSTGHKELDDKAMQAARDSVSFARPSWDIEAAIIIMDFGTVP